MQIEYNGKTLELKSMSRSAVQAFKGEEHRIEEMQDPEEKAAARDALQEKAVRLSFGDEALELFSDSARDFTLAFNAALLYSHGFSEAAVLDAFKGSVK